MRMTILQRSVYWQNLDVHLQRKGKNSMKNLVYPLSYDSREMVYCFDQMKNDGDVIFIVNDNMLTDCKKIQRLMGQYHLDIRTEWNNIIYDTDRIYLLEGADIPEYIRLVRKGKELGKTIYAASEVLRMITGHEEVTDVLPFGKNTGMGNAGELLDIHVPVIGVFGMGEYCDKFMTELYFRKFYLEKGYKVMQFGSKEISEFFGFDSIPQDVLDKKIPLTDRVVSFNQYVSERIKMEKPDLIIVGIQEGIMPFNNSILNNFGEDAFVISHALSIDYSVINVYYDEYFEKEFLSYIERLLKYQFNSEMVALGVSDTYCELTAESFGKKAKYYHLDLDEQFTPEYRLESPIDTFQVYSQAGLRRIAQKTMDSFADNVAVVI